MAILNILHAPNPVLSRRARPVQPHEFGPELARRLEDMAETMYAAPGVGLAAPQVGDSRRILVADPGEDNEGNEAQGQLVMMINPEIISRSRAKATTEESCLSVPEFYIDITRPEQIRVRWFGADGAAVERDFAGFPAVVIQHEMDHLDGVTLLDRASRFKRARYIGRRRKQASRERRVHA